MERFGYDELLEELNEAEIHRLENIMTLCSGIYIAFEDLTFCLVATVSTTLPY